MEALSLYKLSIKPLDPLAVLMRDEHANFLHIQAARLGMQPCISLAGGGDIRNEKNRFVDTYK